MTFKENFITFLVVLVVLAVLGGIGYGIYRAMKAAGIKPKSKKQGETCALDIECIGGKCAFGKCLI